MSHLYVGGMPSQSIEVWRISSPSRPPQQVQVLGELFSPSFLCVHPTLPVLYAAERSWSDGDKQSGAISMFEVAPSTGELRRIFRCRSGGAFTAHVSVSPDGRFLATANPRGPTIALFRLDAQGTPRDPPCIQRHAGRGATPRQEQPWPHSTCFDHAMRRVFACDLGLDRVFIYDLDGHEAALSPGEQAFVQVSSGAGARHMALSGDDGCLYVANELDSTVSVFRYDSERRHLAILQTLRTVPEQCVQGNQPAEIILSSDGGRLFVTNRGHDSVAVFELEHESGQIRSVKFVPAQGKNPRHICLDPGGKLAAVCNQGSHEVTLFRVADEGQMELASRIGVQNPTCAVMLAVP